MEELKLSKGIFNNIPVCPNFTLTFDDWIIF